MRRFVAASLILTMVLSLVGPYYAEATGSIVGNNLIDSIEEGSVQNHDTQSNQSNINNSAEDITEDTDSIESNENGELSTEDTSVNQSNNSNSEETMTPNTGEVSESTEEQNTMDETTSEQETILDLQPNDELEENADNEANTEATVDNKAEETSPSLKQTIEQSSTSILGHIKNSTVKIYKDLNNTSSYYTAGSLYTNAVYYIKKQAVIGDETYYLISTKPSSVNGVIGWVKSNDLDTRTHVGVDKESKTFYIKGTGKAYSKAWGGSKDLVYDNLSNYKGQVFSVNLTERVGNNIWYRGTLAGKAVWIHSSYVTKPVESSTSLLAHLKNKDIKIFEDYTDLTTYTKAGTTYTNAVYYIKKQVVIVDETYYLISTKPSSVNGVVGWVKSSDLNVRTHVGVDKESKTFYIKGTGKAYSKAWGGSKDLVYSSLTSYKNQIFKVNLTEKVGNNTWYRGTLANKTVWVHSSYLAVKEESSTSRLGQIKNSEVKIYKTIGDTTSAFVAGTTYINSVYYIKKQAKLGDQTFYLISNQPSSVNGVIGWVHTSDLTSYTHSSVDKEAKTLYIKGTGKAYSKIWGGSKEIVYSTLSGYKNDKFAVNLTEKVGNNTWYRGVLGGKTVWIHESYLHQGSVVLKSYTDYNLTLNKMLEIQMAVSPQTDKVYKLYLREDAFGSISNGKGTVSGDKWNLRRGPGTNYLADGQVNNGTVLTLYSSTKGTDGYTWYHVRNTSGWVVANSEDVKYYLTPTNFTGTLKDSMQFVKLSESANLNVTEVNQKILAGKGILEGKAQAFIDGGKANGVNEIYLIAHALLETGHGKSQLATGVEVGRDSKGNLVVANDSNRNNLTAIKKTYNMYGINAIDSNPLVGGATYAYEKGWFTPEAAIKGGAAFIGNGYVNKGQDTLYKMRWNPLDAATYGKATHQYATDIAWAYKQTSKMYELYQLLDEYKIVLDIPRYK